MLPHHCPQRSLLRRWAGSQSKAGYKMIYPLMATGRQGKKAECPYRSFARPTKSCAKTDTYTFDEQSHLLGG